MTKNLPDWVDDFLNRRTEVEGVLRKIAAGKREMLTRDECRNLADRLSIPSEFQNPGAKAITATNEDATAQEEARELLIDKLGLNATDRDIQIVAEALSDRDERLEACARLVDDYLEGNIKTIPFEKSVHALAGPPHEQPWLPIETASTKPGVTADLWSKSSGWKHDCTFNRGSWWWNDGQSTGGYPSAVKITDATHWMPARKFQTPPAPGA